MVDFGSECVNILIRYTVIEKQPMHQNDHFIVMPSQMLLHVSAYQRHHQGAHLILTSHLYVGVHYKKNYGVLSKLTLVSIVTLWIRMVMTDCQWKRLRWS
jgi:hypothetical protein